MKILNKITLTGIAVIFVVLNTTAQDKNKIKEVLIDFSDKSICTGEVDSITVGEYYRLVIDNLNLNLYSVAVNYSDTTYSKPLETFTNQKTDRYRN